MKGSFDRSASGDDQHFAFGLLISAAAACQLIKNGKRYATHAWKLLSLILEGGQT